MSTCFQKLAEKDPRLAPFLIRTGEKTVTIKFESPEALRALTCAIMRVEYGLELELPLDRLIPPVPNRRHYIEWIANELLKQNISSTQPQPQIRGIDIGWFQHWQN